MLNGAALSVCVLPEPAKNAPRTVRYGGYIHEILGHAGLCYGTLTVDHLADALRDDRGLKVLLTVGEHAFAPDLRVDLEAWVTRGGAWLSIGGVCGMEGLLGVTPAVPSFVLWAGSLRSLGEGYLDVRDADHPILAELPRPLHCFGGAAVRADGAEILAGSLDSHGRPADPPALLERMVGAGRTVLLTPDVTGTIVRIQQGIAITRDGVPAPDGTAPIDDAVLKSDDGQVLDWLLDREEVAGAPGLRAFLPPVADQWRGIVLRAIFHLAAAQDAVLPVLWYYPDNLPALGHLSHDTDGNEERWAVRLLNTLAEADVKSTWCVILPGYSPAILDAIKQAGHELATHFDAMTDGLPWEEAHFDRQWRELCALFGRTPVTNKNHYLRWEGDTEFFDWCIARGIAMDQSKGASKTGEAGFNFGTCHPYRPVSPTGEILPILELPTPTQDLLVFAPEALVAPLLDAVLRHYGILHLLFHPAHIEKPGVADALLRAVQTGEANGIQWRTGAEIAQWENARRSARWKIEGDAFTLTAGAAALPRATLLVYAPDGAALALDGVPTESCLVERWGVTFHMVTRDLSAAATLRVEVRT